MKALTNCLTWVNKKRKTKRLEDTLAGKRRSRVESWTLLLSQQRTRKTWFSQTKSIFKISMPRTTLLTRSKPKESTSLHLKWSWARNYLSSLLVKVCLDLVQNTMSPKITGGTMHHRSLMARKLNRYQRKLLRNRRIPTLAITHQARWVKSKTHKTGHRAM